jgi:hypothetical protein
VAVHPAERLPLTHVAGAEPVDVVFRQAAVHWRAILEQVGVLEVSDGMVVGGHAGSGDGRSDGVAGAGPESDAEAR